MSVFEWFTKDCEGLNLSLPVQLGWGHLTSYLPAAPPLKFSAWQGCGEAVEGSPFWIIPLEAAATRYNFTVPDFSFHGLRH